jgi:hypothetical protein
MPLLQRGGGGGKAKAAFLAEHYNISTRVDRSSTADPA